MLDVVGLDDDREVGALRHQRGQQLVDVAADAAAVRWHGGRVDDARAAGWRLLGAARIVATGYGDGRAGRAYEAGDRRPPIQ